MVSLPPRDLNNIVHGRNPAPVDIATVLPLIYYLSQMVCWISYVNNMYDPQYKPEFEVGLKRLPSETYYLGKGWLFAPNHI